MDELVSLAEDLFGHLEKDEYGSYLVPVYVAVLGTYELLPVSEELGELLALLESHLNGSNNKKGSKTIKR